MEDNRSWDLECSAFEERDNLSEQEQLKESRKNRRQKRRAFFKGFIFALILVLALNHFMSSGFSIVGWTVVSKKQYEHMEYMTEKYKDLEELYQYVQEKYYKRADDSVIMDSIYKGLLSGLGDKYADYYTEEEYQEQLDSSNSEFEGIGIVFSASPEGQLIIVDIMRDSPAKDAGLQPGDVIVKIDGKSCDGTDIVNSGKAIRGKKGTTVKLDILRGGKPMKFEIMRAEITKDSVRARIVEDVGVIEISAFETKTGAQFKKELRNLEIEGVKGLIVDLRGNGGGVVESAVEIADLLMKEGIITIFEDNSGEKTYKKSDAKATKLPLVLLIDGSTASASEILAAAIKDSGAGVLIGERTYGKGVVQIIVKMKFGGAIKLTTMEYFSPKGKKVDGVGVAPDIVVHNEYGDADAQLMRALQLIKKKR